MPAINISPSTNGVVIGGASERPQLDGLANGNGPVPLPVGTVNAMRTLVECEVILKGGLGPFELSDEEIIMMVQKGKIPPYALEKVLQDFERAVKIRRAVICASLLFPFDLCRAISELTQAAIAFFLFSSSLCHQDPRDVRPPHASLRLL
jgi:hypothetical protein